MNKANLKSYAPKARLDFIKAVTERANVLGISAAGVVPAEVRGDVALIEGREWPAKVAGQRDELIGRIKRHGFEQTMDEVAYTWFNRFAALRYMEIHDYLGHGWRVLSSRDGGLPEILRHASEVTLPGLNPDRAREMQLAGNQDNELYKLLLVAQCNELSRVMPFLFERIDDETELLLPENLLRTDSIVAKLVEQVPEEDWQEIEVIGWLYQFYISEKKDEVIGKVVKSEDIPAATQLFTPNWIVQYLVQNSVGRLWLMANPTSTLASQWPYYIPPAEQTPEVQAQLDALIQTRIRNDGETLNPETITVLDPACGSGHILVVAYDALKAIYLERGYQPRAIPRLILERNLYGLDIDDRAAQLAAFALLMKARADDRRLFNDPPKLNVLGLRESKGIDLNELVAHLTPFGVLRVPLKQLLDIFESAKTFGSLIQIPLALNGSLGAMTTALQRALRDGDLYAQQAAKDVLPLVWQALLLGMEFDAVAANPPYMGSRQMNPQLKAYIGSDYETARPDIYGAFVLRSLAATKGTGASALITRHGWMTNLRFGEFRRGIIQNHAISTLVHLGSEAFPEISGEVVQAASFSILKARIVEYGATYIKLTEVAGSQKESEFLKGRNRYRGISSSRFSAIPGDPIVYSATDQMREAFLNFPALERVSIPRQGMATGDDEKYVRLWFEIDRRKFGVGFQSRQEAWASGLKWFPFNKGGPSRKWYGNSEHVIAFDRVSYQELKEIGNHCPSEELYFREGVGWSDIASKDFAARYRAPGEVFATVSMSVFPSELSAPYLAAFLNSKVNTFLINLTSPGLHYSVGYVANQPVPPENPESVALAKSCIEIAKSNWDAQETSWEFTSLPLLATRQDSLEAAWSACADASRAAIEQLRTLETENNRHFIAAYGLQDELVAEVPDEEVTLFRANREKDCQRLVSYAIGCSMGRYSLVEPGLIYAYAGNVGFDPSRYGEKFLPDSDGILPITDMPWFEDDAASRVRDFLRAVWGSERLNHNMAWLAESLGGKASEPPEETVRRYLADKFFKDHSQTYKKRPIYWLFSSGKHGAFQALVYLHRYTEATLARMRAEYVVPLATKVASRLEMLDKDVAAATSAAARTKLQKQIEALRKKQIELLAYDEKLRHYADMRIALDLDDGVKVNYAKFGDLVAESKAITGGSDE